MAELVDPNDLRGLTDLAKEFGYNAEHLRQMMMAGKIKAWRVANAWVTTRAHLLEYMESRKTEGWPRRPMPGSRRRKGTKTP